MRTKIIAALAAGGVLVGAGFVTAAISSPDTALAQEDGDESGRSGPLSHAFGFLEDVLDGLVEDGTLGQDQADAVVDAIESRVSEAIEEGRAQAELFRDLFEDGVLTEEEAEQLPDDHPLLSERFDEAWEDGELTTDDLRGFGGRGHFGRGFGSGPHFNFPFLRGSTEEGADT